MTKILTIIAAIGRELFICRSEGLVIANCWNWEVEERKNYSQEKQRKEFKKKKCEREEEKKKKQKRILHLLYRYLGFIIFSEKGNRGWFLLIMYIKFELILF